ncbi:MAG: type II secretion system protein M [Halioglobus sp.]
MNKWLLRFNTREQLSLLIMTAAVALYIMYALIWTPLSSARDDMALRNQSTVELLYRVDSMVSEVQALKASGGSNTRQRNLTSLINQTTRAQNLAVTRLQPNSRGDIQVRMENAPFDDVMTWLHVIELRERLVIQELSLTQAGGSGLINLTVRVSQGS